MLITPGVRCNEWLISTAETSKRRIGLADIALREGKLAHVIHHYQEAARVSSETAAGALCSQ